MEFKKDELSVFLYKLQVMYNNIDEFLNKFSQSLTTTQDSIPVTMTDVTTGTTDTTYIPAVGYMKGQINALNSQIQQLVYANDDTITLQFTDGTVRSFQMKALSEMIDTLESIQNKSFDAPTTFRVKNNYFFESFLSPLLAVTIDVTDYTNDCDRFNVKKVILNIQSTTDIDFFDTNYKGKTGLDYDSVITNLRSQGIDYTTDDNIVDLPVAVNRNRGNFSVVKIYEDTVTDNTGASIVRRRYVLDGVTYQRIVGDQMTTVYLTVGDSLITADDSQYTITEIDKENNIVTLQRVFGTQPITVGTANLKIMPDLYRVPDLNINVSYNERSIIFVTPINRVNDLSTDKLSLGFGIFSNELTIQISSDKTMVLSDYYNSFVADFGNMFLAYAKEKQIPAINGIAPNSPVLNPDNMKVVWVNQHIYEDQAFLQLKEKIATKEKLQSEMNELNKSINDLKTVLNTSSTINVAQKQQIQKEIDDKSKQKTSLFNQLSTIISEITLGIQSNPELTTSPKYRIRGFFDIPAPQVLTTGTQNVVQFLISYRYLSAKGTAANVDQLPSTDTNGVQTMNAFSPWTEVYSKVREKELDTTTGTYVWKVENTQDADVVNINQVDIPISQTESVEIRIKAISEAGFPLNPLKSDWSNTITIDFPSELSSSTDALLLAQSLMQEQTRIQFEQELNAEGLDIHLLGSVTKGDKYYAHKAEDLASGFFNADGSIIDLFAYIKSLTDKITALETAITQDKGVLKVTLTYPNGYVKTIANGELINIFAGYYQDDIKIVDADMNVSYDDGKIVEKTYILSLQNTSATHLALASRLAGGIDQFVPTHNFPAVDDYDYNRIYDLVPISVTNQSAATALGSFKHKAPFQSGQARSQFVYTRHQNYGLGEDLYVSGGAQDNPPYDFQGKLIGSVYVPFDESHYIPYKPNFDMTSRGYSQNSNVWNGGYAAGATGNGWLSELCFHINHPEITSSVTGAGAYQAFVFPTITSTQQYPKATHGLYFELEDGTTSIIEDTLLTPYVGPYYAKYYAQCHYRQVPTTAPSGSPGDPITNYYPVKNTFAANDKYLIGKYSCGAYLFMGPAKYEDISIDGNHPKLAQKILEYGPQNAINIPIIFQYRCNDILKYVGGYRLGQTLSNVKYTKKIGLDIYQKLNSTTLDPSYGDIFSFDIQISAMYQKEAATDAPVSIPATGVTSGITYPTV